LRRGRIFISYFNGILELDSNGAVSTLVEKPAQAKSNLALAGAYVFDSIFESAKKIKPSRRNELKITDAIEFLVESGKNKRTAYRRLKSTTPLNC
jgi:glucose-1-phosphate thymidylyltransferase